MTLSIRKASSSDILNTFNLSNDSIVRQSSFTSDPILFQNHEKWFNQILDNKSILFYVIHDGENFVSQIRYKKISDTACEISISITEEYRGKHVGSQCLSLSIQELKKNGNGSIVAEVKEETLLQIIFLKTILFSKKIFKRREYCFCL